MVAVGTFAGSAGTQLTRMAQAGQSLILVLEDVEDDGKRLIRELSKWEIEARLFQSVGELVEEARTLSRAMIAVDINLGLHREEEGLDAIRQIKALGEGTGSEFYIVALTTYLELEPKATEAGVDAFIQKESAETDALELVTRLRVHAIEVEEKLAQKPQTMLALREYDALKRQLTSAGRRILAGSVSTPIDTIRRSLNWPFLFPNEQLVLSALDQQLRSVQIEGNFDKSILELCLDGVALLQTDRARDDQAVSEWIRRATRQSPGFVLSWLNEDDLDDEQDLISDEVGNEPLETS